MILIYVFAFGDAVFNTSSSLTAASAWFFYLFHSHTKLSLAKLLREAYLKPVGYSITLILLLFTIRPASGLSWLGLGVAASVFGTLYAGVLRFSRFFDMYDWDRIEAVVPVMRVARRLVPVA
jgi:hypothetical protein